MGNRAQELLDNYSIKPPSCGASIPDGWFVLVELLIADLISLGWDKNCQQIKVKFGGLRFYIGDSTPALRARIYAAENEARVTCSVCGSPGTLKNNNVTCVVHDSTP